MTKTNFTAKADVTMPRQRNIHRKKAPAGFAEILDEQTQPESKPAPAATTKAKRKNPHDATSAEFGPMSELRGPTGTVIAEMTLRQPSGTAAQQGPEDGAKATLPYARTRGTFVRVPTFADLGRDAATPAAPEPGATVEGDPWLPPAPTWGQSRGPDPELVQTPPEQDLLATAVQADDTDAEHGVALEPELGWEALEPDAEPMVDLEEALGAFEIAVAVEDGASDVGEDAANYAPTADFDTPVDMPEHGPSFLSAVPTVTNESAPTYGANGNVFTAADPEGPVARNVEVFRTALNRAAITVDTDDGQIELAITTAGKHVMVEATAAAGFTDSIQRDLEALRHALDRHDLELTELSFGDSNDTSGQSEQSRQSQPPTIVPAREHGEHDVGFRDDGRQTWVVPTGFRVVA